MSARPKVSPYGGRAAETESIGCASDDAASSATWHVDSGGVPGSLSATWPFVPTPRSPAGGSRERQGRYDGQAGGLEYFDDMVAYTDECVGRLLANVDRVHPGVPTLLTSARDGTGLDAWCDWLREATRKRAPA